MSKKYKLAISTVVPITGVIEYRDEIESMIDTNQKNLCCGCQVN